MGPSDKHLTCKRIRNPSEDSSVVMAYIFWQECNNSVEYVAITEDESSRLLLLPHTCPASRLPASVVSVQSTGNLPAEASRPLNCVHLVLLKCVPFIVYRFLIY